jgi:hypothetical protein
METVCLNNAIHSQSSSLQRRMNLKIDTNVLEEHTASLMMGALCYSETLVSIGKSNDVPTQKTNIDSFTAVRSSNLT